MTLNKIHDLAVQGKKVLVRADLNIPLDEKFAVSDPTRIKMLLPTIKYLLDAGAQVIIASHLGDPAPGETENFSLKPIADKLSELLKLNVVLAPSCIGAEASRVIEETSPENIVLLENLRFHPGEKKNDPAFARKLAELADVFVFDAFATAHRSHASIVTLPRFFEEKAIGLLVEKELNSFKKALGAPRHPLCVVLGGVKVSSKIHSLLHIAEKADKLIIGGAIANTFLAAQGLQMGRSRYEPEMAPRVIEIMGKLARRGCHLYLPVDLLCAPSINSVGLTRAVPSGEIPPELMALDIGPASSILFKEALETAETIVWSGPMGAFEKEEFSQGTTKLVEALASSHGYTYAGGAHTDAAIFQMELGHKFNYIATGGEPFLIMLEGQDLPGLKALEQ
jgi:phosphoglycerate kinase